MSFLTSLAAAFKGGGGARVPLAHGFVSPWAVPFETRPRATGGGWAREVEEAYLVNPIAQRAVRIVAEGVGGAPLAVNDESFARLLATSGGSQPLIEVLAAQLLLHGNAYVQVLKDGAGAPVELFPLRPDRIVVEPDERGWPGAYRYRVGTHEETLAAEDADGWPQIVHLKTYHPGDDHYGAGCLGAARQAVAVHNAASRWNAALLENAARPSGALVYDTRDSAGLTGEQFDRLKEELAAAFSGDGNAGRPMVLEGGLSWQSLALSPADMDFANLKAAAARDIALAFGVPPMLLGLPGDNTYANYREANRALWRLTLLPLIGRIGTALAQGLAPWFPEASVAVDLDKVPALAEDREKQWARISDAEFLDEAEKRELLGLPPRPAPAIQSKEDPR